MGFEPTTLRDLKEISFKKSKVALYTNVRNHRDYEMPVWKFKYYFVRDRNHGSPNTGKRWRDRVSRGMRDLWQTGTMAASLLS